MAACDRFFFTEILNGSPKKAAPKKVKSPKLRALLESAVSSAAQDDGWAALSGVGNLVNKNDPSFDSRNFGYKKLSDLVRAQGFLEVDERQTGPDKSGIQLYVRIKES